MRNPIKNLFRKSVLKEISGLQKPGGFSQDLVNEVVSYIYDIWTLRSCSTACQMMYYAALPRLYYSHETLVMKGSERRIAWPQPLKRSHKLGLLPLVKQFSILHGICTFGPEQLNGDNLRYFSALKNLRELSMCRFELAKFMPNVQPYFNHFVPTLQSLSLTEPRGSTRQILYFIGLFPNLQDFELYSFASTEKATTADLALIPPSIPPLNGWLAFRLIQRDRFIDEMIALYGGLHFCHVYLDWMSWRQVLGACAETLKTLQLDEGSLQGEDFFK